ncbi:ABC transporter permease [Terrisporobacter petrolearius]|uniref:ABC transporter permease n=1 Tax=Terrisporobacter petrolearius TaxID=1460447 RepID=UPI001D169524|nr:ABC transporter permease [Terrisporobacter petrolearius]MCC3863753.1 ABC transporter permease [Terrisporobacter petrolearius]
MINLIKAELFKLKRNHTFWILVGVVTVVYGLANYLVIIDWWGLHNTSFDSVGLKEYNAMEMMMAPLFFNLTISTLAGFFINVDHSTGTIKNQILSGNKRSHIYLAKLIVFSLGSVITAVILPVITAICLTFLLGYSHIYTNAAFVYLLRAFSLYTLSIIAYSAIIMLVASLTRESGKTIIITIIATIILYGIEKIFVPKYEILRIIYENSIFYQIYKAFSPVVTFNEIGRNILICAATFVIMAYCGSRIFRRIEIK